MVAVDSKADGASTKPALDLELSMESKTKINNMMRGKMTLRAEVVYCYYKNNVQQEYERSTYVRLPSLRSLFRLF